MRLIKDAWSFFSFCREKNRKFCIDKRAKAVL